MKFTGLNRFSEAQADKATGLQTGDSVTQAQLAAAVDKLAKSGPRKEYWRRMMQFVEGIDNSRIAWLADAMVSAIDAEFNDKLGEFLSSLPRWND